MLAALNFTNLSAEGYASFILALIFTILTLASAIFFARHKEIGTVLCVIITLILPIITIFCWIYLLLTVLNQPLVNTLCISFACAVGYGLVASLIAFLVSKAKSKQNVAVENVDEESTVVVAHTDVEDEAVEEKQNAETEEVEETPAPETVEEDIAPETVEEENKEVEETTENVEETTEVAEENEEAVAETIEDNTETENAEVESAVEEAESENTANETEDVSSEENNSADEE